MHPPEGRQGCGGSAVDRGKGDEGPGAWSAAQPRTQDSGGAEPVGEARRNDPCRHQAAGFCEALGAGLLRAGRSPHHPDRRQGRSRGVGYEKVHVAVDDATRLAYVEVLADEQKATTVAFLTRAVGWFS